MTATQELKRLLKARFFPYLEERGLVRESSPHPQFTVFRRFSRDTVQVLDIQWDKYGRPIFVVNFGEGPRDGVRLWGEHVAAEALQPRDCPESGRLQRRRGASQGTWFQLDKPLREALFTMNRRYSPEVVVDQVIAAFPEVESWWKNRTVGSHLSITSDDVWKLANDATATG